MIREHAQITVRTAGPFDLGRMARMHRNCFTDGWSRADLAHLLALPGGFGLLARASDGRFARVANLRAAGFTLCRVVRDECEMLSIGVMPHHRRLGVAKALLMESMARCIVAGAERMFLEVAVDNDGARHLYQNAGFKTVGRRNDYYKRPDGSRVHAYTMLCDLPALPTLAANVQSADWQSQTNAMAKLKHGADK